MSFARQIEDAYQRADHQQVRALLKELPEKIDFPAGDFIAAGYTALQLAAMYDVKECFDWLMTFPEAWACRTTSASVSGFTMLHCAAFGGNPDIVRMVANKIQIFINAGDSQGWSALHVAARHGKAAAMKCLIEEYDCNVAEKTRDQRFSLADLVKVSGDADCVAYFKALDQALLRQLFNKFEKLNDRAFIQYLKGERINYVKNDLAPLPTPMEFIATYCADEDKLNHLMQRLKRVRSIDTAFIDEQISLLNKTGYIQDENGQTELHRAVFAKDVEAVGKFVANSKIKIHLKDGKGLTPLHHAARVGNVEMLLLLLSRTELDEVNTTDPEGRSALHFAAMEGHDECVQKLLDHQEINADLQDANGRTAYHLALQFGRADVAELLIVETGLDPHAAAGKSQLPIDLANASRDPKTISLFESNAAVANRAWFKFLSKKLDRDLDDVNLMRYLRDTTIDGKTPVAFCAAYCADHILLGKLMITIIRLLETLTEENRKNFLVSQRDHMLANLFGERDIKTMVLDYLQSLPESSEKNNVLLSAAAPRTRLGQFFFSPGVDGKAITQESPIIKRIHEIKRTAGSSYVTPQAVSKFWGSFHGPSVSNVKQLRSSLPHSSRLSKEKRFR